VTIDILRTDGRGRRRPEQPWRRTSVAALRIRRIAADLEAERDRHPETSGIYALLDAGLAIVQDAASAADPD
jgi:hypothetical protein